MTEQGMPEKIYAVKPSTANGLTFGIYRDIYFGGGATEYVRSDLVSHGGPVIKILIEVCPGVIIPMKLVDAEAFIKWKSKEAKNEH